MDNQKTKKNLLKKDEESDPDDLKAFIRKNNTRNKVLRKILDNITKANNSNIEGKP